MTKQEVIAALEEIALWLELKGENPFKVRAYGNAVRSLQTVTTEMDELIASGELAKLKGFGEALVKKVTELVTTGRLEYLENLRAEFPPELPQLLEVPGVGPKKVKLFYEQLRITSVEQLEAACRDGRVAALPGCGEKTAQKILAALERRREYASLFLYVDARALADEVVAALRGQPGVARIEVAGSLRRYKEVTKDLDLLVATTEPAAVMAAFVALPSVQTVLSHGETKSTVILGNGMQADLRAVPPEIFPYALHHFTGSKDHNVAMRARAQKMGLKISEWGLFRGEERIPCADEAAFFQALGLHEIPPELREDMGEIAHAEQAPFPALITPADYRGVLHCHTVASDGANRLEDLVAYARSLGHRHLGITDHSRSSFQAHGLEPERLLEQVAQIRQLAARLGDDFALFAGVECDILPDGRLDYPDDVLAQLDYVIVSVHSAFTRTREEMTQRVVRAIEHPRTRMLAHPTGRLLLRRDPYEIDLNRVIDAAAANQVAIELNCHPQRLDLDWRLWHQARDKGVRCNLDPDAHDTSHFGFVAQGIGFARKGWLRPEDVLNCWPAAQLRRFFARQG